MRKGHNDPPIFEELLKGRNVAFASAVHAGKNCLTNTLYLHSVAVSRIINLHERYATESSTSARPKQALIIHVPD